MKSSRGSPHQHFQTEFVVDVVPGLFHLIVSILVFGGDKFVFELNNFFTKPVGDPFCDVGSK